MKNLIIATLSATLLLAVVALARQVRLRRALQSLLHDALEAERKAIAARRHRDPIIANAVTGVGLTLACLLPLVLCWYLLRSVHDEQDDAIVTEILIEELGSEHPTLLPPFAAEHTGVEHSQTSPKLLTVADDQDDNQEPVEQRDEPQNPPTKRTRRPERELVGGRPGKAAHTQLGLSAEGFVHPGCLVQPLYGHLNSHPIALVTASPDVFTVSSCPTCNILREYEPPPRT